MRRCTGSFALDDIGWLRLGLYSHRVELRLMCLLECRAPLLLLVIFSFCWDFAVAVSGPV